MYEPTLQLTDSDLIDLHEGVWSIQRGQWVQLPHCTSPSRWVGRTSAGSLWAVHSYQNSNGRTVMDGGMRKFKVMCDSLRRIN